MDPQTPQVFPRENLLRNPLNTVNAPKIWLARQVTIHM